MSTQAKNLLGIALLATSLAAGAAFLAVPAFLEKPRTGDDLCVEGKPIRHHHLFVIDQSDPVPERYIDQLNRVVEKTLREMGENDRVSVYYLNDTASAYAKDHRSICNPGRGESANPFYQNPQRIEAAFRDHFLKPLRQALAPEALTQKSPQSPIMEFLHDLTRAQDYLPAAERRTYTIVSDFIQNSALLNQYQEAPTLAELLARDAMSFHSPSFLGARVNLIYIERPEFQGIQTAAHKRLWRDYFLRFGAAGVELL